MDASRPPRNAWVIGSIPIGGSTDSKTHNYQVFQRT